MRELVTFSSLVYLKSGFSIFFFLTFFCVSGQNLKYFSIIPNELSGDNNAGVIVKVAADSQYIYLMGHLPKIIPGQVNRAHASTATLDYQGNLLRYNLLVDSSIAAFPYLNEPLIKKNDSIYFSIFQVNNNSQAYNLSELFELNLRTGHILKRKLFYDTTLIMFPGIFGFSELKNNQFQIGVINYAVTPYINYLFDLDTGLNVLKSFVLPYTKSDLILCRFISKDTFHNYELIIETKIKVNGMQNGIGFLSYIKLDENGHLIKKKDLPLTGNFFLGTGEIYSILQNSDKSFIIAVNDWGIDTLGYQGMPYFIKTSPEFDSILWKVNFYEYPILLESPRYYLNFVCRMNDKSGFVACGDIYAPAYVEPDYGLLFKVSEQGDSLWLRKYQPLGWDSIRAGQVHFKQLVCTPYNTLAVAAYVGDRADNWIHPWVLHLDGNGCLIPGCNQAVSTKNIRSGKEKAFLSYPNPITDNHLYLLSRINSSQDYKLSIVDLNGRILKSTHFRPQDGMQYMIELPEEIHNGVYILSVDGVEYSQSDKIIIDR